MNCYKIGGCGVYENRSCDECPASKPEYLNKNNSELEKANALVEKYKRELDAAISDMKVWLAQGKTCQCCKYNFADDDVSPCDQNGWVYGCSEFEWRGLPE